MSYLWLIFSEYYYIFNFLFGINFRTIIVQKKTMNDFQSFKIEHWSSKKKTLSSENSNRLLRPTAQTQHLVSVTKKNCPRKKAHSNSDLDLILNHSILSQFGSLLLSDYFGSTYVLWIAFSIWAKYVSRNEKLGAYCCF